MTEDGWPGRHGDLKFGGLSWPMSVVWRLASGGGAEVLTAEITEITEMEMGGRGTFSHESHEFSRMEGGQEFLSTDFTD